MSTPNLSISLIALAILQAFAAPASAQSAQQEMPEVVVTGNRAGAAGRASVAGFSDAPLLQTPASVSVVSRAQMQDLQIRSTSDAMKFDASVNDSYNAVGYAEQFSIRGFALDNSSSYRKDGLAIPGDTQIPLENKERIEVLKGLAGFQSGVAAPGGIIDFVVKRPTAAPLRSVTVGASERGTLYGAADLGGRFEDRRFGYRINAAAERLRSYIKGADGNRKFVSGAFDWQISPQALLQIDADYQDKSQVSAPGFQLLSDTALPGGVGADAMLNLQRWSMPVQTQSSNIGLRFHYQLNPEWHATLSANRHSFKRDDYTAFPYGCSSGPEYVEHFCGNGDYDVYDYRSLGESKSPLATQALVQGKFSTGALRHEFTAGTSYFHRLDRAGVYTYDYAGTSNIYRPVLVAPTGLSSGPVRDRRTENERAVFAQDILALASNWKLHAGLRYVQVKRDEYLPKSDTNVKTDDSFLLPNAALVYNPLDNVAVYGAYSQGMEHGGVAPHETSNHDTALAPSKSKQIEVGVKADLTRDLTVSAALFQIRKGLEYTDSTVDPKGTYVRNGLAQHRGLELAAQGKATPNLSLGVSATALNTQQSGTGIAAMNGKRVTNVPAFKSSVYADYAVPQVAGLKLNGTWLYAGKKAFTKENTVFVPAYHVLNLGAAYATKIGNTAATLRANVDNALDKFYWRDVTQESGGYLFPGAPRTLKVSAQFDF
ncbi:MULTISPECIES: TonB-dependent siderophore receptor [unclassified Janthinobacterium]|uniref:TonB-dependent siderophore receptor n=1 Tax=unclassified Janthinobacterium TaxID=2610881 RepID=UPI000475CF55|nr:MULTISPECIES: TonB-dependent siderophore receptor [unclassified Janthinobacterium]MEC5164028.1 iron complex outermembrane receptor protein [Janthinobacterium sp. CG_S6]